MNFKKPFALNTWIKLKIYIYINLICYTTTIYCHCSQSYKDLVGKKLLSMILNISELYEITQETNMVFWVMYFHVHTLHNLVCQHSLLIAKAAYFIWTHL